MHSNGIISAPISASDPYQVLGVGIYGGGYDIGYICSNKHGKINKWAKYKPVRYNVITTESLKEWYRAQTGDCGLEFSKTDYLSDYKSGNAFAYKPPTGGDAAPFRLLDFEGYDHKAEPFVRTHIRKGYTIKVNYQIQANYTIGVEFRVRSEAWLTLADLNTAINGRAANMYLCADIYNSDPIAGNASFVRKLKADQPIMSGGTSIRIDFNSGDIGTTRWVALHLYDETYPVSMPIPFDDDNYPVFAVQVVNDTLVSVNMTGIANYDDAAWFDLTLPVGPSHVFTNPSGFKPVKIRMEVTNDNPSASITLNSQFEFKVRFYGKGADDNGTIERWITDYSLTDINGASGTIIIGPKQKKTVVLTESEGVLRDFLYGTTGNRMIQAELWARSNGSGESGWKPITTRGFFAKQL